jgi:hypothetical protein
MIRRGDLDGRPPGMGAALFPVVSEMNGQHAPPTGDHQGRPYGWCWAFSEVVAN